MINKKEILLFSILKKNGVNLSQEEKDFLQSANEDDLLHKEFEDYIHLEHLLSNTPKTNVFDTDKSWTEFSKRTGAPHSITSDRKKNLSRRVLITAACFSIAIVTVVMSYLVFNSKNSGYTTTNTQLVFDSGSKKTVVDDLTDLVSDTLNVGNYSNVIITNKNEISFTNNAHNQVEEILLTVPKGKKYKLVLSDGSKVTLNGDSKLLFPNNFTKDERTVSLKGEAFFEVAHDAAHPFNVFTNRLKTTVLGTKFNVLAYPESTFNEIVLVEGKVRVSNPNNSSEESKILLTNQKAYISSRQALTISKADVNAATAWLHGALVFKDQSFRHIAKTLERNYNTEIEITNEKIKNSRFTGYFKDESIIDILEIFKTTTNFEYQIKNNRIIIK